MAMSARGLCLSILCLLSLGFGASCSGSRTGIAKVPSVPVASISGTVRHVLGNSTFPLAGAQVCVEGTTNCTSSASDGSYALGGIAVGPAYLSAEVAGYLPGETRTPIVLTEVDQKSGIDIILSGKPSDSATYVGSAACQECHVEESLWHSSAHFRALDRTAGTVDVTGWPAEPATCAAPATADSGNTGANPTIASPADPTREVYLVRWHSGCGAGKPPFAMAFDTNQDGSVGAGDTIIPLNASIGGVATDVGQCGNGGILPANAPCVSNLGGAGTTNSIGWWQQEYLTGIGGPTKPAWVTWDTSGTPNDLLVMPLAWNQQSQQWVAAPDYNTSQTGTWSKACAGCHEVGLTLAADANGNVTQYSSLVGNIGCEKCHGPASDHVANLAGDARFIVNPKYLKADAAREVCAQCHSQGVASASPAGVYGFAWNDQASVGGGNFIPGVHKLSEFMTAPSFGDSDFYWPAGFPSSDHLTAIDFGSSAHVQDAKLTCGDCHPGHALTGGPESLARVDEQAGRVYEFQKNDLALRDDVVCLSCHAGYGSFAGLAVTDAALYHLSMGGAVLENGAPWSPASTFQAQAAGLVASVVEAHMVAKSGCTGLFNPTGYKGAPVGRCSTCHMAKTAFTGTYFSAPDANGKTANLIGDVSAHTFAVATPDESQKTLSGAASWDAVMPNGCGACHAADRFGM